MKSVVNVKKVSEIAQNILDIFYMNGFHKELAKDKENYGCEKDETFIEHSVKTLNFGLSLTDLYYEENPERNTDNNLKKLVAGSLFHDINKISKYKRERETDFELEDIEKILSDLGLYSEFNDCSKFIIASAIHRGRKYNTYKLAYSLDENEEEIKIIRYADALASVHEIDKVVEILKEAFLALNLNKKYKINYLTIKEIRPAITNVMLKALEKHMEDTGRRVFCYYINNIIYVGEKINFDEEIDDIVNRTLSISTKKDKYIDAVASNVRDNKNNFNFFDMFLILDLDDQLEVLKKCLTSKNDDILFRALKNRFEKVKDKLDKHLLNNVKFEIIDNILKRKEDEQFIDLVRQIFICLNSYHVFLNNKKVVNVYEEVWNEFNKNIFNINELHKNSNIDVDYMKDFKDVLDDGGSKTYYILLSSYIANLILQREDYREIINKIKEKFRNNFKGNIQKFCTNDNNVNLLKQDIKDYYYEILANKVNDSDYIIKDKKIESTCLICGRKIPDELGVQKGFLGTKYSFKSKPKEIILNDKGRLTKEITQQPYLCKICAYDTLLQKIIFDSDDTYVNPDVYVYIYKNIDFPISIETFKDIRSQDLNQKVDERTLIAKKFYDKSIFIKAEEKELEIEIHKKRFTKELSEIGDRFKIFTSSSSDTESILKIYFQALLLSYYYGLNVTVTSSKALNINNTDILFSGEYKNIYLNKVISKKVTQVIKSEELEQSFYNLNSLFLIDDIYNGFKGDRNKALIPIIMKMSAHPLGIFNYLRFKDSKERNNFMKTIYENNLVAPVFNSLFRISNLNGGAHMSVCSVITEKMLKFWKPKKSDSSYIITLPFRRSIKAIKESKSNDLQEIKELAYGSVRDLVERHNSVYSPAYGEEKIKAIKEFVDEVFDGYYEGVCKCKKAEMSKNENFYASAIEFLVIKSLYENDKNKEEVENE